ncbi:MAG: hypothetical protein J0665_19795 [Deltaproteobacteria bacterium]|nr:hypothetical protein [Deltaproteobacteria bacterium]
MKKIDPSKVPLIPDNPDVLSSTYSFSEDTVFKIKALFPEITSKKIDAMARFLGEHIHISQIMDMSPDKPRPDMGLVAKELHAIQEAVETLQGLLSNPSDTASAALYQAYTQNKSAPTGITDRRFPRLKDVSVVLDAFKNSMHSSNEVRGLVEYGIKVKACGGKTNKAGRPPGGTDYYPYILLDGLNEILYPDGGMMGQTEGVKLGEILGVPELLTEKYIKNWRKMMLSPRDETKVEYESDPFEPV